MVGNCPLDWCIGIEVRKGGGRQYGVFVGLRTVAITEVTLLWFDGGFLGCQGMCVASRDIGLIVSDWFWL